MIGTKKEISIALWDLPDGMYELKEWKRKRTLTQNNYFHALVGKMAQAVGSSITEVKNQLVADYGVFDESPPVALRSDVEWQKLGIHLHPSPNYEVINEDVYQLFHVMKSTTQMTTAEFSHLVDGAIGEAKQLGIETLPPHELEAMRKRERDEETRLQKRNTG